MRLRKSLTILLAGTAFGALPALAQNVGTATAVNPTSQSTRPGGAAVELKVGARIVHNERIKTTTGTVHLLFLDKTTMSVGPNANLLINDYVYNPASGKGHMAATLVKGALRFVGGRLSHQDQAQINTPVANIGIRGGTVTVMHDQHGTRVINLFGVITIHNSSGNLVIRRPGFAVTIGNGGTLGPVQRVTRTEIAHYLHLLTSHGRENGGVPGLTNTLVSQFNFGHLQAHIGHGTWPTRTDRGESDAYQLITRGTQHGTLPNKPPQQQPPPSPPPPPPPPPPPTCTFRPSPARAVICH